MNTKVEKADGCRRVLRVEAAWDEVSTDYEQLLKMYRNMAAVPGFRKGKAPVQVVERHYLKNLQEEARERLLPRFYKQAVEAESLKPVNVINVENIDLERDKGFTFDVTLDVTPEFKLPKYKKLSLKGETVEITDEQVTQSIDTLRERLARFEDVTGRPVKTGDLVQIDYTGSAEGKALSEMGDAVAGIAESTDFWALVDEPEFLPGMTAALTGMEIGGSKKVDVTFPEDFRVEVVRGLKAEYDVALKAMRTRVLPEIDEEFLKNYNAESEKALRTQVSEELKTQADQQEKNRLREQVGKILVDKTKIEPPESVVAGETRQAFYTLARNMIQQGVSREDMDARRDQLTKEAQEAAISRVKLTYILSAIADGEELTASDEEFEERIRGMAQGYRMTPEQLKAQIEERDSLDEVREDVRRDKAMDVILENAKIKR